MSIYLCLKKCKHSYLLHPYQDYTFPLTCPVSLENAPHVTLLFGRLPFSFSSKNKMQADEMNNRSSLHSMKYSSLKQRGSVSRHVGGHFHKI